MLLFIYYLLMLFILIFVLLFLCFLFMTKFNYSREKYSIFECGFDCLSCLRLPFSLHFYFISMIFLIFDVELILILPFIFVYKFCGFFLFFFFLFCCFFVLLLGFFYEWWSGFLSWLV